MSAPLHVHPPHRAHLQDRPRGRRGARVVLPLCGALLGLGLALPESALAQDGESLDIELVRPTFSPRSTAGVDSPFTGGERTLNLGAQLQFTRDPLRLIEFDRVAGAVVRNRTTLQLGVAYALSDRVSVRASLPFAVQWGSEIDELSGDGLGVGDLTAGLKYQFWEGSGFTLGAHGDLFLNSGSRQRYMGEIQPRTAFGMLGAYETGPVLVLATVGVQTRFDQETGKDFVLGDELTQSTAVVIDTPVEGLAANAGLINRFGMARLFQGGAETSSEWTIGAQYGLTDDLRLDLLFGRGLTAGYGTSTYRGIVSIRYERHPEPPPEPEPDFVADVVDIPDLPEDPPEDDPPEDEPPEGWREGELARQVDNVIEIREPIQFEFATSRILPESIPTLRQVGQLVNGDARIGHLLIEGHASEEGSFAYNYDLSIRRAKAIFEQLIVLGVHPERMSYRGMGEVVPLTDARDEAALEANRRVEFEILFQYDPDETRESRRPPQLDPDIRLPWNGDDKAVDLPPPLPSPKPKQQDLLEPDPPDAPPEGSEPMDTPTESDPMDPSSDPTNPSSDPASPDPATPSAPEESP